MSKKRKPAKQTSRKSRGKGRQRAYRFGGIKKVKIGSDPAYSPTVLAY